MKAKMEILLGLGIGILGILIAVGIAIYQARSPSLSVVCQPLPDGDPTALECEIHNEGRAEARDVYVSFDHSLPMGTRVFADAEVGAQIVEAEAPPDPTRGPEAALLLTAFSVRIPRVAAKDRVRFQVRTTDPDNQRAARQVLRIRREIASVLSEFGARLRANYPDVAGRWDTDRILDTRIKEENFFSPGRVSYERGRRTVSFFSDEEKLARANCQDLYAQYKKEFLDVFQNRPEFKAPVIKVKTAEGERTYARFPPYLKTSILATFSRDELRRRGKLQFYPPIPESYD